MQVNLESTSLGDLEKRLHAYEYEYGTSSEQMLEAFCNGRVRETPALRQWSMLFRAWQAAAVAPTR